MTQDAGVDTPEEDAQDLASCAADVFRLLTVLLVMTLLGVFLYQVWVDVAYFRGQP